MQVGLPDAWLDRNDCPGIQEELDLQAGAGAHVFAHAKKTT